jgi:hypothetical protein
MLDCWLWDLVDCMRYEEEKIAGMNATYTVKTYTEGADHFLYFFVIGLLLKMV